MSRVALALSVLLILTVSAVSAQQQIIHTVTAQNKSCNATCSVIDVPELNGNPIAIILITPILVNGGNLNPHPIGAYYMYLNKWSVFNVDSVQMNVGAKFKVEYYVNPAADRFLFIVPQRVHTSDVSYIDHAGLNSNPNAQVRTLPANPPSRSAIFDREDYKVEYDATAAKWFIANLNGTPVPSGSAFNVVFSSGGPIASNANPTPTPFPTYTPIPSAAPTPTPVAISNPTPNPSPTVITPITTFDPIKATGSTFHDWNLHPEPSPSIPANSDILLFIHGMDSRAEEADDITKALFALKANPPGTQAPPAPPSSSPDPQIVADLLRTLHKYEGCIRERYETKIDMINRHLSPNASALATTSGLQDRDANVFCVAGNLCSLASRKASYVALEAQANRGDPTDFEMNLKMAIPADCFECQTHQEWHTKHVHCTMEVGGNQGVDLLHPERNFGPYFETCKAGMDLAKLMTTIINEIHTALSTIGNKPSVPQSTGGPTIATNFSTVKFDSCPNPAEGCPEQCDHPDNFSQGIRSPVVPFEWVNGQQVPLFFEPMIPPSLLDTGPPPSTQINVPAGRNIGRNEGRLRADLRKAARDADPLQSLRIAASKFAAGNVIEGNAFADLSVTGRQVFQNFLKAKLGEASCVSMSSEHPPQLSESAVLIGCRTALDRAYRVANFLRTGQRGDTAAEKTRKTSERIALGWIAVSGEDDSPHRPVNAPSSDYPQYDFDVVVEAPRSRGAKRVTVHTRYVIAQSQTANPNSTARNLVVISLDLPSSGYSENLDYEQVSPLTDIGNPKFTFLPVAPGVPVPDFQATGETPLLDFIENFIVRFAERLDQETPVKNKFKAVMGGSLGGNMTFRLGRRPGVPWLPKFVVWSPASIWFSLGEGNDPLKHQGPRKAWENADKARQFPADGDRAEFFGSWDSPVVPVVIPMAQSDTWTSDYYPCKKSSVAGARLDRHETYDARFLAWHWRLGAEQLLYSHQTNDPATNQPRYMSNNKPMLLACGSEDTVAFNDICPGTKNTAPHMIVTPGKALFLDKTGHSLDNERRSFWAREVFKFLGL